MSPTSAGLDLILTSTHAFTSLPPVAPLFAAAAAAAVPFPFALFADATGPAEIEPAPFLEAAVFDPEIAAILLEVEVAAPAFTGRAAATSFPINLGFFAAGEGDACF